MCSTVESASESAAGVGPLPGEGELDAFATDHHVSPLGKDQVGHLGRHTDEGPGRKHRHATDEAARDAELVCHGAHHVGRPHASVLAQGQVELLNPAE